MRARSITLDLGKKPRACEKDKNIFVTITIDEVLLVAMLYNFEAARIVAHKQRAVIEREASGEACTETRKTILDGLMQASDAVTLMSSAAKDFNSVLSSWSTYDGSDSHSKTVQTMCDQFTEHLDAATTKFGVDVQDSSIASN